MALNIARHWRLKAQRYNLVGEICPSCSGKIFPPRDVCPHCEEYAGPEYQFSGKGTLYSYSVVHSPPEDFVGLVPYTVALIKLNEGPMITAQLTDIIDDNLEIGMKVEMVTRKLTEDGEEGVIHYGYKFRPELIAT